MGLAANLRFYRKKFGLSQEQIAEKLGYKSFTTIQKWEMGISEPSLEKINILADLFGVSIDHLISNFNIDVDSDTPRQYPFIPDAVAAGIPCTIEGRKELPTIGISDAIMGKYAGNKHILIMRVNGESMNNVIPSGSFIAVKTDIEVKNLKDGNLVVFGKEHEYSLKRFYDANDRIIFKPDSSDPRFTDHVYNKNDSVFIVGRVVLSIRNYE
ncbi:LexA family protein [Phascolarctobacterium faecium]|uniref:LexA family protein n=1 Tax=Phascolarctobacterium faecium TaxID=33025 RepID=UPI003AB8D53D